MPYYAPTKTVNDVARQVRRTFGDEAAVQISDTDLLQWCNDAQQEIVDRNKMLKSKSSQASVQGQSDYTFPNVNIVSVDALHYDGRLLKNTTFSQAEQLFQGNTPPVGQQPYTWWEYAGTFTLYPAPPDSKLIELYATIYPPKLLNMTDTLGLSDKFYRQVVQYVLAQAHELDEDLQMAEYQSQKFGAGLQNYDEEERRAQNMTMDTITLVDWED